MEELVTLVNVVEANQFVNVIRRNLGFTVNCPGQVESQAFRALDQNGTLSLSVEPLAQSAMMGELLDVIRG